MRKSAYPLVFFSLLATSISSANVTLNETYLYYDVRGNTAPQIRKDINEKRLLGAASDQYDAQTLWSLTLRYKYRENKTTCSVSSASVSVIISYRIPRWQVSQSADSQVREAWDKYITLLKAHENGHGKITFEAGSQLYEKILATTTPSTPGSQARCNALEIAIDNMISQEHRRVNEQQVEFDKQTNHGASFP